MAVLLRRLVWLLPVLTLLVGCAAERHTVQFDSATGEYAELDRYALSRMQAVRIPGIAYAVVEPTGVAHTGVFGVDGDGDAVTASTPFLWGSVAKPVAATVVTSMAERGEVRLDAPVITYLPSFRLRDAARSERITLRHLLAQTSGLPTSTRYTDRPDAGRTPTSAVAELTEEDLVSEPGAEHHYSSTNYLVLAAVVEAVTGRSFIDVLTERLLVPLGMDSAVIDANRASEVPKGHRFVFGRPVPFDAPFDPAGVAYGYLGGTLRDAAAFASGALGGSTGVISDDQRASMFRGETSTGTGREYGLGWRLWSLPGTETPIVWHGGAAPGYFAQVILLPEQKRAVVLLANSYSPLHESRYLHTGFGLARLLATGTPAPDDSAGRVYPAALTALALCLALLLALNVRTLRLITRRPADGPLWRPIALGLARVLVAAGVLYGLGSMLPASQGTTLPQMVLWTPDLAWLVYGILLLTATLLLARTVLAVRTVRGRTSLRTATRV